MLEADDARGPDWFYLDSELEAIYKGIIDGSDYVKPKHLVLYSLWLEGVGTGVVVMLAVESVADGLTAMNWFLGAHNMHAEVLVHSGESISNCYRIDAMKVVLSKFKYTGKLGFPGSDKLYLYGKWMAQLICD